MNIPQGLAAPCTIAPSVCFLETLVIIRLKHTYRYFSFWVTTCYNVQLLSPDGTENHFTMDYFFSIQILINFILEVNKSSLCMHKLEVCYISSTIRTLTLYSLLAVPCLKQLVACLSPWRLRLDPRPDYVGFVVTKVAKCQVFLQVLQFSSVNISPPVIHTHISFINQ